MSINSGPWARPFWPLLPLVIGILFIFFIAPSAINLMKDTCGSNNIDIISLKKEVLRELNVEFSHNIPQVRLILKSLTNDFIV